ncbi:MAG TPA: PIN domain-containing protein [Rhodocyclaceae bacterium]|nr:PIN domain-containing protein [Rhodocyclaceae bacterium]
MYLLDTSIISDIVNSASSRHKIANDFLNANALFLDQIYICIISLGEMRFGREARPFITPIPTAEQLAELDRRVTSAETLANVVDINRHVAADYARLRAAYAKGMALKQLQSKKLKSKPPELWQQDVPASQLQITENDLWIAAIAVTYDLILVTADKDYQRIKEHFSAFNFLRI